MTTINYGAFDTPGRGRGILDVVRYRYLLKLLIGKSTSLRYRNSVLGWFWSYVRPTVQFLVYYLVVGQILGLHKSVQDFALYMFSGIVVINLFNESLNAATSSIVSNKALVRKIYLPRELFPIAAIVSAFTHFLPQMVILLFVCIVVFGSVPTLSSIGLILAGLAMVLGFILGIGLFFSAINVRFRDAGNAVEIIRTVATWCSPILYTWIMIYDLTRDIPWVFSIYMSNPVTIAVELFHQAFWEPAVSAEFRHGWPPDMGVYVLVAVGIIIVSLVVGQTVFRRAERTFAQDL